jgi:hypothetical protein
VNEVADNFREQMKNDTKTMVETAEQYRELIKQQEINKSELTSEVDKVERVKEKLEQDKVKLIEELTQCKTDQIKKIDNVIEEIEQQVSFIESLVKYTDELRDKGTA